MSETLQPYENTLPIAELRYEVRRSWNMENALTRALVDLPEVPPLEVLRLLTGAGMNYRHSDVARIGKSLQREADLGVIPYKFEFECAAGLWKLIRDGLISSADSAPKQ